MTESRIRLTDARLCIDCETIYWEKQGTHCPICCSPATAKLDDWLKPMRDMKDIRERMETLHEYREKRKGKKE